MSLGEIAVDNLHGVVIALALAALGFVLYRALRRSERRPLRISLGLLVAAFFACAAAAMAGDSPMARMAAAAAFTLVGFAVIQVAAALLFGVLLQGVAPGVPRIAHDLTASALSVAWALFCLRLAGLDPTQLFATSALVTAVVAFAMQDTLGNVLGGIVVQLDNSLHVGDWLRSDDINGQVVDVRWRYTTVRTRNGELVIMPNSSLMKNRFFVIRAGPGGVMQPWRRGVTLQVDWQAEPSMVIAALEQGVRDAEIAHVLEDPPPSAVLMETGAGYFRYTLRYWLADPRFDDPADSAVRMHALAALTRAGVRLGLPQEERLTIKENADWYAAQEEREGKRRFEAIRHTDLFAKLPVDEQRALASRLVHAPFAPGDTMTRQGAVAHWLYLIVRGEARVFVATAGAPVEVGRLGEGTVFGEMGLLTGEPRSATVVALTAVDCFRLDKAGFAEVLRERPEIAAEISSIVAARNAQRHARLVEAGPAPLARTELLDRILRFFSLRK